MHSSGHHASRALDRVEGPCVITDVRNETIRIGRAAGEALLVANANNAAVFEDQALAEQFLQGIAEPARWVVRAAPGRTPTVTWEHTRSVLPGTKAGES